MAQVFISESSRRDSQVPQDVFESNWDRVFGERKPMVCKNCKQPSVLLKNDVCPDCQRADVFALVDRRPFGNPERQHLRS